jgi:sec-independent protein translocase protein TatB
VPPGLTSPVHLAVIIVVALIVLGPDKLPQALRQVGRTMAEVRRWSDSISSEMRDVLSVDLGDEAPAAQPPSVAPVPTQAGNGNAATHAAPPAPTPLSPAAVPMSAELTAHESRQPSLHAALQEGGEWS